jgi:glycosyltransferase involved in cell wall biosynthesis
LESALAQTAPPAEVIVVDDRSTDDTHSVIGALADREGRVNYIRRTAGPAGPAATRNVGVRAAQGELVAFLDDDDRWLPGKLEEQLPWFERGYGRVCSNATRTSGGPYFPDTTDHEITRSELLVHNPVIFSTAVARRSLLAGDGSFREGSALVGIEDYELLLRLSDAGTEMIRLGKSLALYRDEGQARLSSKDVAMTTAVARMSVRRSIGRPLDFSQHRATARNGIAALAARRR